MMAAVVIVAVLTAAWTTLGRRATRFRGLADYHARWEEGIGGYHDGHELGRVHYYDRRGKALTDQEVASYLWHAKLSMKYQYASLRPWWPVAPDPPEPK
jgi:hypothetical protein